MSDTALTQRNQEQERGYANSPGVCRRFRAEPRRSFAPDPSAAAERAGPSGAACFRKSRQLR